MKTRILNDLKDLILSINDIDCELVAMDGTGHTSDYADKYYAKIRGKYRKGYIKNHIAIDVDTRLIITYSANKGPKYDTEFAIAAIRKIKKYKPRYILADKAYDSEPIRKCINEEVYAFDQIPLKKTCKNRPLPTKQHIHIQTQSIFAKIECRKCNIRNKKKI